MAFTESEFGFELRTCRWAEECWPPGRASTDDRHVLVGRQTGTRRRRWDTVVLECDPGGIRDRARFGDAALDGDLLHVVGHAPDAWRYYRDSLPHPGYPWRYVRESIHDAADRGVLETRRNGGRIEIRRRWPYPDWVERVVAIENKPDLDASAARALGRQIEHDVALGLADEVWVATRRTDDPVEPALLEDLPVEAGILTIDPDTLQSEVLWHPQTLPVEETGTRILEHPDGGRHDDSAARFEYVDPSSKAEKRLEIAERVYERGWRSFVDTMRPDCRHFRLHLADQLLPRCDALERLPTSVECSGSCPAFEPEPPAWRQRGWPIHGGPGRRYRSLLERRRDDRRPAP